MTDDKVKCVHCLNRCVFNETIPTLSHNRLCYPCLKKFYQLCVGCKTYIPNGLQRYCIACNRVIGMTVNILEVNNVRYPMRQMLED